MRGGRERERTMMIISDDALGRHQPYDQRISADIFLQCDSSISPRAHSAWHFLANLLGSVSFRDHCFDRSIFASSLSTE